MQNNFELVAEASPSFCPSVKLYKWKSKRTGLQSVLIRRKSPSVQGYFAVASEANDNSGCPHTLEHIVFMGSDKYPYKGLLDKLSATQMSSTNAWTAQDQTCYTLSTAGYEGFMNLLPVYLDHILNATVTDDACVTEVYHVDGKGEEKGVVFSEMQGYEHTSDSLMTVEAQNMLFDNRSGYATNTGGCLSALRTLQPETIKQYHKDVYRPSNLSVIIAGDVEPQEMVNVLEEFDNGLEPSAPTPRPFVDSKLSTAPSPLTQTSMRSIEFPDSMESSGEVLITWLGPHISDLVANTALQVVTTYLWMQDSGKLEREFVNVPKEKALASEVVGFTNEYLHTQVNVSLYGVPILRLQESASAVIEYLENKMLKELDFNFLKQCIDTVYDGFVLMAEENVYTFVNLAICDFLYGDKDTFSAWLGRADEFETIRKWSESDWRNFIKEFTVTPPKACVLGRPSRDAFIKIDEEKKSRLEETKRTMDLENEAKKLQMAIDANERPIPESMLSMFPIPDVSNIRFITSQSAATPRLMQHGLPGSQLIIDESVQQQIGVETDPCNLALNFENVPSQFVAIKLFFSTQSVDSKLFPLIPVILANTFASPMKLDDGRYMTAEEVSQESQKDLLQSSVSVDLALNEVVTITAKAKVKNYVRAIEWIKRCMFNVVYDAEYTSIFIARHLKSIPEVKRTDEMLLSSSIDEVMLTDESLRRQSDVLISEPAVLEFESNIDQTVMDLKKVASQLFQTKNIRGLVVGNVSEIARLNGGSVLKPWADLEERFDQSPEAAAAPEMAPIPLPNHYLSSKGLNPGKEALVTLCAASDSTNLTVVSKGPMKYGHPDLPALIVVNTFLDMTEGPFWKAVRGPGLAYGASLSTSVQMGHVMLSVYSAADGMGAFEACRTVVRDVAEGREVVDEKLLSSVVATIVGDLAGRLAEPATAIEEKFADTVVKGYKPNYVQTIINEIRNVTPSSFLEALKQYLLPLFDAETSSTFAVAPPSEENTLKSRLESMGFNVTVREVEVEESSDDEDEDSDEEDDEEDEGSSSDDE